jgi:hypothetical protein
MVVVVVGMVVVVATVVVVVGGAGAVVDTPVEEGAHPATKNRTAMKPRRMTSTVTRPEGYHSIRRIARWR